MSTLRVSNIEAKADASSPTVNEKLKVTNSNGDVLIHVNGETSGITTIGVNTTGETVTFDSNQNATFSGDITTSGNLNVTGTFTSDGLVGIGTDNPDSILHLNSSVPRFTLSDTGTNAHHRINADSSVGNFGFDVDYDSATSTPAFFVKIKGDEKVRITSGGEVQIANGNLKFSTAGTGIDFSATADAAGMTSELLDDYEEGTWIPTTTNFTHTTDATECRYTKIGRMVYLTGQISRDQAAAPTTAILVITGLPYAQSSVTRSLQGTFWLDNLSQSDDYIGGISYANTTSQIIFTQSSSPTHTHSTRYIQGNYFDNNRGMLFSLTYITD